MNSLDCFLINIKFIDIPLIYFRVFWQMVLPIAYWLMFSFLFILYSLLIYKKPDARLFVVSGVFLLIYLQPDMVALLIGCMSCRKIGIKDYILLNTNYSCDSY
jgi:hypothetical protein